MRGPHVEVILPDPSQLAALRWAVVMWKRTKYAHIMMPIASDRASRKGTSQDSRHRTQIAFSNPTVVDSSSPKGLVDAVATLGYRRGALSPAHFFGGSAMIRSRCQLDKAEHQST